MTSSSRLQDGNTSDSLRRDPLTMLSADVLGLVFGGLPFRDRARCTGVSKQWRRFLLQGWPDMWKTFHIQEQVNQKSYGDSAIIDCLARGYDHWLFSLAPPEQVRHFVFEGARTAQEYVQAIDILHQAKFSHLQTLEITNVFLRPILINEVALREIIRTTGDRLEKLTLNGFVLSGTIWPFIFSSCKRLTHLTCMSNFATDPCIVFTTHDLPPTMSLQYIHWHLPADLPWSVLLQKCPDLRYLSLDSNTFSFELRQSLLSAIQQECCPNLRVLRWDPFDDIRTTHGDVKLSSPTPGLRKLFVGDPTLPAEFVANLILRHQTTLLELDIDMGTSWALPVNKHARDLPLEKLSCMSYGSRGSLDSVYAFLEQCPALLDLRISGLVCDEYRLLNALAHCPQLVTLEMNHLVRPQHFPEPRVALQAHLPHLERCAFGNADALGDHFFSHLKDLTSLLYLGINRLSSLSDAGMVPFLSEAPHLKDICLSRVQGLDDGTLLALAGLRGPTTVSLITCWNFNTQSIRILHEVPQLELWTMNCNFD